MRWWESQTWEVGMSELAGQTSTVLYSKQPSDYEIAKQPNLNIHECWSSVCGCMRRIYFIN